MKKVNGMDGPMRLYDTASQTIKVFNPEISTSMYVCGITPYDATHLGHAFTYLTFDLVIRRLEDLGHEVKMVRNVTVVDDFRYKQNSLNHLCYNNKLKLIKADVRDINLLKNEIITPGIRFKSTHDDQKRILTPKEAFKNGIATVYQELLVFPELTVAENIFLGHTPKTKIGLIDWKKIKADSRKILDSLDSHDLDVNARVGSLSVANRQRVEIAKALSQKTKVLIMDEPTAALADTDVKKLITVVKRLREQGVSILYVSHKMPEIFELSDKVSVLRDGNHVGTFNIKDVSEDLLVSKMVGRPVDKLYPISKSKFGKPILEVDNFTDGLRFKQVSFKLKRGEILGIAGVVGSGRSELAQSIFGINPSKGGSIKIDEKEVSIKKPKDARNLGIAYIPEDRGTQGLVKAVSYTHLRAHET